MTSRDLVQDNIDAIGQLFPNCIKEVQGEDGKPERGIDFEVLKQELSRSVIEGRPERYEFNWPGKRAASLTANTPIKATLRPCREESVNFDTTENLYIEGDNLDVLKLLCDNYRGKIKMIYIDPPYNTGNDFIYKDDFRMDSAKYAEESGAVDDEGNRMVQNSDSNGRFHSDWCSMIYSRLLLARNLLTDDGVIFISIDDNEQANLKKICDEVFGGSNFVSNLIWQSRTSISNDFEISLNHNHTLIYSKKRDLLDFGGDDIDASEYINPDNDPRGPWKLVPLDANHVGGDTIYPVKNPKTGEEFYPPNGRIWCYNKAGMQKLLDDGRIKFGLNDDSSPKRKLFLKERIEKGDKKTPSSIVLDAGTTKDGTVEIMDLFDGVKVFDYPKPVSLLTRLLKYGAPKGGLVLDFFSGSGTTAHACFVQAIKNVKCNFICVQLPENLDKSIEKAAIDAKKTLKEAVKYLDSIGKKHTICEIGKERIRRAGDQILELSLQNLEKEGIVEKYARELPEIRSLEEVYGSSGIGLCLGEEVAEGGNIRSVGSNSQGCGVDSVEHSGGAISGEQGVCPVFENSKGITSGTGNTIVDLRTLKILNENGYRIKLEALGRNQQNDLFADKAFDIKGLSSKLSVLNSDRGFRVLKIDDSNMKDVYYSAGEISQQDLVEQISNIKDGRTDMDLLFGCLVDWGVPLSLPIKTETIENLKVYNVNDGDLVACFANNIPEAAIRQIAATKPLRAVFRDSSFKSDSAKINVTEIFKTISPSTTVKVV